MSLFQDGCVKLLQSSFPFVFEVMVNVLNMKHSSLFFSCAVNKCFNCRPIIFRVVFDEGNSNVNLVDPGLNFNTFVVDAWHFAKNPQIPSNVMADSNLITSSS